MTFIIAEAGVNHNGDRDMALELVRVAARSGADAVKFQTFSADRLTLKGAEKAEYQRLTTGAGDQHGMLKALEMSEATHRELHALCNELGIEFMSTAFDDISLEFLVRLGIKRIKVPSGEITNFPFLRSMASKGLPLIVSTGTATLAEVIDAVRVIEEARRESGILAPLRVAVTILHCTSNYPAQVDNVNLRAMCSMAAEIGLPIGYSDHTLGSTVSIGAVALGAQVIEKHFTLDKTLPGPDHGASLDPEELVGFVKSLRAMEIALGSAVKEPVAAELAVRNVVRRSVTVARFVPAGATVGADDLLLLRPGTGIQPRHLDMIIGRKAARDIEFGKLLEWSDIE